jgi:alkanesulfonate monooxygenase SsuD/methylene tetrahydromethanopterin reductase-like flavin-dependent oxidoreductase (luciferase family)
MDIDIILEPNLRPQEIAELGILAERNGIRGVWAQNYSSARDAFMSLIPLAQQTRTLKIGVVIVCPYEMHPMKITNALLTLNEYSDGRAMVVVGSGGEWPEVMQSATFYTGYQERLTNVRETLEIMKQAIDETDINYSGENYSALRYSTRWHKATPPVIYHGACGPRMLRMGSAVADGVMMSDVMPAMFADRLPVIERELIQRKAERGFCISNFIAWHVREDRARSLAEARRELIIRGWLEKDWLEPYLDADDVQLVLQNRWPFFRAWVERHGNIDDIPSHIVDTLVNELSLAGDYNDIDRHLERLQQFAAAGFTEIALRIHENPDESIHLLADRVLPKLAGA